MGTCISQSLSNYETYSCMDGIEILIQPSKGFLRGCDKEIEFLSRECVTNGYCEEDDILSNEAAFEIQMTNDGTYHCSEKTTKVKFGTVEIRQYAVTIGDHPSCSDSLPITLDWAFNPLTSVEAVKDEQHSGIYPSMTRRLSYSERKNRLMDVSSIKVDHSFKIKKTVSLLDYDSEHIQEEVDGNSSLLTHSGRESSINEEQFPDIKLV
eukprot:CAMPEP_0194217652 /NCGR_PEP_ID=MMETSP0156-20130528/21901_1 /TAXON_ID=33649 /ORGANISM="Thalassionema nitzschioides, Strain L26-B" /LENGTH=208 /DNA_ID=CAMNT_0038946759 /DNA_START=76 /DNA_END=702 /DNA_ORIENTATION=-